MSYTKQNFSQGQVLTAEALNKMDEQIKKNADRKSFEIASETIISQKNSVDHVITPQHIDHAVRESTIQRMTDDREADLASMKVSDTFGNDYVGVDKQNLPVSYNAVRGYIKDCLDKTNNIKCIILQVGEEYVLKQNHHYYIHGYGDNALRVLYAEGDKKDQNALIGIEYVDDIDASISSTYVDNNNYWQMFRCWIRDRSIDKVGRYTDWQHNPLVATKVRNEYVITGTESGYAYLYEMPVGNGGIPTIEISDDGYWVIDGNKTANKAQVQNKLYKHSVFINSGNIGQYADEAKIYLSYVSTSATPITTLEELRNSPATTKVGSGNYAYWYLNYAKAHYDFADAPDGWRDVREISIYTSEQIRICYINSYTVPASYIAQDHVQVVITDTVTEA